MFEQGSVARGTENGVCPVQLRSRAVDSAPQFPWEPNDVGDLHFSAPRNEAVAVSLQIQLNPPV